MTDQPRTGRSWTEDPWTEQHSAALLASPLLTCNFHELEPGDRRVAEDRLRRLRDLGEPFDPDRPDEPGPHIIVGFYDCYRYASLFGADVCTRLGIRAHFFPTFDPNDEPGSADLTDDELAEIATAHEIGLHTWSHVRSDQVTEDTVDREVDAAVARITALAGRPPRVGAWRGGTRFDPSRVGDRRMAALGVGLLVSNWSVEVVPGG